jgi:hypothetical protein
VPPTTRTRAGGPCTGAVPRARPGRYDVRRRIEALDPHRDFREIYRLSATVEFPWDHTQALSLALFRTYAVPSIGGLLARTGAFTEHTQKRHDDTVLILDAVLEHGPDSPEGRTAIRRMNGMHRYWGASQEDLRYVLCTFVVTPIRWLDDFGWRRLTEPERIAAAEYYRDLGRRMGIRDIPATWQQFARAMAAYERARFGFHPGARAVAEATLQLLATFPPFHLLPPAVVRRTSLALLDPPLVDALRLPRPTAAERAMARAGMRARARVVRWLPPRREPLHARQLARVRSYPDGYDVAELGTFPDRV